MFELHFQKNTCYLVFKKATGMFLVFTVVSGLAKGHLYIYFNIYCNHSVKAFIKDKKIKLVARERDIHCTDSTHI